jgi:Na+/proline symporter
MDDNPLLLAPLDIAIIVGYLVLVIGVGWLLSRRAGRNLEAYYLSGKSLPWYLLGVSHGASGFDITGTMWFALMLFVYGGKGIWILWIWPMFAMVFRMMYLGVWIRRSNVLTGAEWMRTRFAGPGLRLAHLSMVLYAVVGVIGFLAYAFKGIGKFAAVFFPWDLSMTLGDFALSSPEMYAILILMLTAAYLIVGGMYSVVLTDLVQFFLLAVAAVAIAVVAMMQTTPEQIAAAVPEGWENALFGLHHGLDWSDRIPLFTSQLTEDGWDPFSFFIGLMLFKGILVSLAGPTPGYGIQHVLATRNPREAALESAWISVTAFFPRFLMIAAIVVLGLVFLRPELLEMGEHLGPGESVDLEPLLPLVIQRFLPVGLRGLVLAGLLAAFMSTFDSTVNAGSAYVTNDIYKRYIDRNAPDRRYVIVGYVCSILIVVTGILFGLKAESIGSATKWIVTALFGGFTAPNILKWVWWRFNGYGFFAGMMSGVLGATVVPLLADHLAPVLGYELTPMMQFPIILAISAVCSVGVCLATPREKQDVLDAFYQSVRPWGWWQPVYERLRRSIPRLERNTNFGRDMLNCAVGILWQTSLVATPIYLVLRRLEYLAVSVAVLAATSLFLKVNWYDKLGHGDLYMPKDR